MAISAYFLWKDLLAIISTIYRLNAVVVSRSAYERLLNDEIVNCGVNHCNRCNALADAVLCNSEK